MTISVNAVSSASTSGQDLVLEANWGWIERLHQGSFPAPTFSFRPLDLKLAERPANLPKSCQKVAKNSFICRHFCASGRISTNFSGDAETPINPLVITELIGFQRVILSVSARYLALPAKMVQFAYLVALLGFSVTTKNFAKIVARPGNRIPRTVAIRRVKV